MELADAEAHLALQYISTVSRNGAKLTSRQLEVYVSEPQRSLAKYEHAGLTSLARALAAATAPILQTSKVQDGETMTEFLIRVDWAHLGEEGQIFLTDLGKAVLADLNNPRIDASSDHPISVVIDPDDRLAYARVFDLISNQSKGLIVEPYFGLAELTDISRIPSITRVLTSDHKMKEKRGVLEQALSLLQDPPQVRFLPLKRLHDRLFITDAENVVIFGSSLNSITKRPGVITTLTDPPANEAMRASYGRMWEEAEPLVPRSSTDEPGKPGAA